MIARELHYEVLHAALDRVLGDSLGNARLAWRLGLRPAAAQHLHLIGREAGTLRLGFDDRCPGAALPRVLRSPLDGTPIAVQSGRCSPRGVAHAAVLVSNETSGTKAGTLGAILRDRRYPRQLFALTAGHVLAAQPAVRGGDRIAHVDAGRAPLFDGVLLDWYPDFDDPGRQSSIDAAISQVDMQALEPVVMLLDRPAGVNLAVQPGTALRLLAASGPKHGYVAGRVSCRMAFQSGGAEYLLLDALSWSSRTATEPGDSGAPVWDGRDWLVGIHAGSEPDDPTRPICVPILRILEYFGADAVLRGEPLSGRDALPARNRFEGAVPAASIPPAPGQPAVPGADVLARTMWGEARGEGVEGMRAVAHVVINRAARRTYWGITVEEVCRKPWQFSCWNLNDPNLVRLLAVGTVDPLFRSALEVATALLSDARGLVRRDEDPTDGATHYHTRSLFPLPRWAVGHVPCARIGSHVFYNDIS